MIGAIHKRLVQERKAIDKWFGDRFSLMEAPIYSSADIRFAGYKISVVDTNLFPAGFNNLCETFSSRAADVFRRTLSRYGAGPLSILILPEAHTRNQPYWENIQSLLKILSRAGANPIVGRYAEIGIDLPEQITLQDGSTLPILPVVRNGKQLSAGDQLPDLVLLNNDFSHGFPDLLCGIHQPVVPSPALGWHQRRKSDHFKMYGQLISEVAALLDLDPWILNPFMSMAEGIDIHEMASRERLKDTVDDLIARIRQKHEEYKIESEPYVFIKDNSGTYGMGIMHVTEGKQVLDLGRRKRNKMSSSKGRSEVTDFLVQEGLPTAQFHEGMPLEPVFYLVNGEPIGNFFRIHDKKSARDNLNSSGMSFNCLCSHQIEKPSDVVSIDCDSPDKLRTVGGFLARVASYAGSLELEGLKSKVNEPGAAIKICQ